MFYAAAFLTALASATTAFAQKVERPTWVVGDKWEYKTLQRNDGNKVGAYQHEVESIVDGKLMIRSSGKNAEGVFRPGSLQTYSPDMNYITRTGPGVTTAPDNQALNWPLENEKKYLSEFSYINTTNAHKGKNEYKVVVTGPEDVVVEAGTFRAYKIVQKGFWTRQDAEFSGSGSATQTIWYAPEVKRWVKWEIQNRNNRNSLFTDSVDELVKFTPGK